jgi:glutamate-5-semialdehyde dehydrogenase
MTETELDPIALIQSLGKRARAASVQLTRMPSPRKADALLSAAEAIREQQGIILSANAQDMERGQAAELTDAMLDRLALTPERVASIAAGVEAVSALRDPVGMVMDESVRPNGLKLSRVRVPLGVVGIIYESRPNVTADAAALCLKSGNAVILRGGSEAAASNRAIHAAMIDGITRAGVPADAIQLVPTQDRAAVGAMLAAHGMIDIIIPRGGNGFKATRVCPYSPILMACVTLISTAQPTLKRPETSPSTPRCAAPASAARPKLC